MCPARARGFDAQSPPARKEALADGRCIIVRFGDAGYVTEAVNSLLDDPDRRQALERSSYA